MKVKELVEKLNALNIEQRSLDVIEDIPSEFAEFFKKPVLAGLDLDIHRHYELATSVFEIEGEFLGVRHVSMLYSEQSSVEDICRALHFLEMEEVPTVTYRKKENPNEF